MDNFEVVLLLSPDLSNPAIIKEEENFEQNIGNLEGKLISNEDWGLKDLNFNINNHKKAFYKFYQIEADGKKIQDIKKILTQNEKVLRYLFIKVEKHQILPTKMIDEEK